MKKAVAVIICAIIFFAWGFISWTVLPWHDMVANEFTNESEVAEVIKANAPKAGVYYLPFAHEDHKAGNTAAFVNALPEGYEPGMKKQFVFQFIADLISALIIVCLLSQTAGLSYLKKVGFVTLIGAAIGFTSHFPYWNWFGFSTQYVVVTVADSTAAGLLAGLAVAKLVATSDGRGY